MKWILAILLLNSIASFGQVEDSTKYIWYKAQYGQRLPRGWWDSVAHMPYYDTSGVRPSRPGAIMMRPADKEFYKWNGTNWIGLGGGSSATLSNVGSGFRWVKTPGGQVKSAENTNTITWDSTSNTLKANVDTSYIASISDLKDSSAALRAAIGSGGGGMDSARLDSIIGSKPYRERTLVAPQGCGLIVNGNSISQSGVGPAYQTYADMLGRYFGGPYNNYSIAGSSVQTIGDMLRDVQLPLKRSQVVLYNNGINDIRFSNRESMRQLLGHVVRSVICNSFRNYTIDASSMTQASGTWTGYNGLADTYVSKTDCLYTTDSLATLSFGGVEGGTGLYISFITNAYNSSDHFSDSVEIYRSNGGELIGAFNLNKKGEFDNAPYVVWLPTANLFSPITIVNKSSGKLVVDYAGTTLPRGAPCLIAEITKPCTNALQPGITFGWWDTCNAFIRQVVEDEFIRYGYPVTSIDVNNGLVIDDPKYFHELPGLALHPSTYAHATVLLPQTLKKLSFANPPQSVVETAEDVALYGANGNISPAVNKVLILPTISQNSELNICDECAEVGQKLIVMNQNTSGFTWNAVFWNYQLPDGTTSTFFPSGTISELTWVGSTYVLTNRYKGLQTLQETLSAGSTLNQSNSIDFSSYGLSFQGTTGTLSVSQDAGSEIETMGFKYNSNAGAYRNYIANRIDGTASLDYMAFNTIWNSENIRHITLKGDSTATLESYFNTTKGFGIGMPIGNKARAKLEIDGQSPTILMGLNNNTGFFNTITNNFQGSVAANNLMQFAVHDGNGTGTAVNSLNLNGLGHVLIGTTTDNGAALQVNGDATVADDAYDATTWNGNLEVPTKNAIRDKIESLVTGGSDLTGAPIKANIHIVSDADYTVASTDYIIIYSSITADRTLTIPAASSAPNRMLIIRNPGGGSFSVNLSQTYRTHSSSTSNIVAVGNSVSLISDGTEWWVWDAH